MCSQTYMSIQVFVHIYIDIHKSVCMYLSISLDMHICMTAYICVFYMHVVIYICRHTCMYTYMCIYIYNIHIFKKVMEHIWLQHGKYESHNNSAYMLKKKQPSAISFHPLNNHINMTNTMVSLVAPSASYYKKHAIFMYVSTANMALKCQICHLVHMGQLCQYIYLIWPHCNQLCG